MRLEIIPESPLERVLLAAGTIPTPIVHTIVPIIMSRVILAATKFGLFTALANQSLTASEVASTCGIQEEPTLKLLNALEALGYVRRKNRQYLLSKMARQWLTESGRVDLTDAVLHRYLDMRLLDHSEAYLQTGKVANFHDSLSKSDWKTYVAGQRSQAQLTVKDLVRRIPIDRKASSMLDIGGSHGLLADAMCRKHPILNAIVFDLPDTHEHVDKDNLSERVSFQTGNILVDDIGEKRYDLIFMGNVAHHFDSDRNQAIFAKARKALKTTGVFVLFDFVSDPKAGSNQIAALIDFYFAVTSGSGSWTRNQLTRWIENAGLSLVDVVTMRSAPGMELFIGRKDS